MKGKTGQHRQAAGFLTSFQFDSSVGVCVCCLALVYLF